MPIDSTTIYLNKTDILGGRKQFMNNGGPITIPGVPTDLLSGSLGQDYAATAADTDTIVSFDFTDAVVTQPTPYDVWMRIGIYTETPNVTVTPSSDWTVWPSSVCGVSSAFTYYSISYSTWISGTRTIWSTSSSATAMYTSWRPRNQVLYYHVGVLGNQEIKPLNATYLQIKTSQFTEPRMELPLPTNILDWLASQEEVIREYPYITNCYVEGEGVGQPTVHVPVNALTVTSSHFLGEDEAPTAKSSEKQPKTITLTHIDTITSTTTSTTRSKSSGASTDSLTPAPSESEQSSSDAAGPANPRNSQLEDEESNFNETDTFEAAASKSETTAQKQTLEAGEISSTSKEVHAESDATRKPTISDDDKETASPASVTETEDRSGTVSQTVGMIDGLVSAIRSVVAQQGEGSQDSQAPKATQQPSQAALAAVTATKAPEDQPAESVMGFVIGSQTASPGGDAVTRGGSIYTALSSGSGLRVVADGQTSTLSGAALPGVTIAQASNSDNAYATSVVPVAASADSFTLRSGGSEDDYVLAGNTLSAGESALISAGMTYSALPSGSGIIIVAGDSTSTASVGESIGVSVTAESDLDLPTPDQTHHQQLVTISGNVYTTSIVSNGTSNAPVATTNNGTLPSNSTAPAQTTQSGSSTHGLGDAIMSGIGGGATSTESDDNSPSPESTDVEASSDAGKRSVCFPLSGLVAFGFMLAI